ncbi:hypothetical protein RCL1_000582 [Eukaryota sp. TZLM3-RCL]
MSSFTDLQSKEREFHLLPKAGSFMKVLPISEDCTFNGLQFTQFLQNRLLFFNLMEKCNLYNFSDLNSSHFFSCKQTNKCIIRRHDDVRYVLFDFLKFDESEKEKKFTVNNNGKEVTKIADLFDSEGKIIYDITVVGGHNFVIDDTFTSAINRKNNKYSTLLDTETCNEIVPLVFFCFWGN